MLRHLGAIAVSACIVATVGCEGKELPAPTSPLPDPNLTTVAVAFGGRMVNADTGGPVANVRISVSWVNPAIWATPNDSTASAGDGTFTLPLNLPSSWEAVQLKFTGPAGYDTEDFWRFAPTARCTQTPCWAAADRPAIGMYPTLVIRPGESIEVRIDGALKWCGDMHNGTGPCRRVLVAASPGEPVELEIAPHDSSSPMAFSLEEGDPSIASGFSPRRLMVSPGELVWVSATTTGTRAPGPWTPTGTLTARR